MTTPERALELAKKYEMLLISRDTDMFSETAAILRHYAEIMQAEPVAEIHHGRMSDICWVEDPEEFETGTQLIIKPAL